jgi:hypothetical protein
MALGLSGSFGARAAQEALRQLQGDRIAEEQRGIENQQVGLENQFRERQLADMEADTDLALQRLAMELSPVSVTPKIQGGMLSTDGRRVLQGLHPITGDVMFERPEFVAPEKPPTAGQTTDYGDFLARWANAKGKTMATLTAADEVQARREWGQADDRPPQPFILMGPMGPLQIDRGTGVGKSVTDGQGNPIGPTPSQGTRERMGEEAAGLDRIADIASQFNPAFVGPAQGRWDAIRENIPDIPGTLDDIDPKRATFRASVAGLKNDMIRLITGAAVSAQEQTRILQEVPDVTQRPEVFQARLEKTRQNRANLEARIAQATGYGQAPVNAPSGRGRGAPPPTGGPQLAPGEKLAADGVTVLVKNGAGQWVRRR